MTVDLGEFCALTRDHLGGVPVGMSLTSSARAILDRLGPRWLASTVRAAVLAADDDRALRFEFYVCDSEPMANQADLPAPLSRRVGMMVVGRGRPADRVRRVSIPSLDVIDGRSDFSFGGPLVGPKAKLASIYSKLYKSAPLVLDTYRQWRGRLPGPIEGPDTFTSVTVDGSVEGRVMWIAMHWAETGGAESWAWEQARLAREAGFSLVITFDRAAPQRLLDRAFALTDDVYVVGNVLDGADRFRFVQTLVEHHGVSHVHIHHSEMAYGALPFLRLEHPGLHVEDSTHIIEHHGGGFVRASVEFSDFIDLHHVISPQLVDFYRASGVDEDKIAFRPLTRFTLEGHDRVAEEREESSTLRVGFMGRLSPQKRPYLFLRLARLTSVVGRGNVRFIMQGTGELDDTVRHDKKLLRLDSLVERRGWASSDSFFRDVDVLVVTSENEGLTLTTLEADAANVLVISANVGSQASVIAPGALLPRAPIPFLRAGAPLLRRLAEDPGYRQELLAEQHQLVRELAAVESASVFFANHYQEVVHR